MQLKINNIIIPLETGTKLPVVLRSPLFLTDKGNIPGSYIFNFSVPAGPEIRNVFGQAHRPQRHGRATVELPYTLIDGALRFIGNCIVSQAAPDSYEISCKIDNGDFNSIISGKTLKDINWGGDIVITDMHSVASAERFLVGFYDAEMEGYTTFDVDAPMTVINDITASMGNDGRTFVAKINTTCTQIITLKANFTAGSLRLIAKKNGIAYIDNTYTAQVGGELPPPEIATELTLNVNDVITLELTCITESYYPQGSEADIFVMVWQVEYKKTNVFTEVIELNQDSSDYTIFPIYNKKFMENFPEDAFKIDNLSIKTIYTEYFPFLNYWKNNEFPVILYGVAEGEPFIAANLFTPFVYLNSILRKIIESAGYTLINSPFDNEFKNAVLFNAYAENNYAKIGTTILPVKTEFNLVDHVPAIPQSDFIKWVSTLTGYMPVVDNKQRSVTFSDIKLAHIISNANPAATFPGEILTGTQVKIDPEYAGIKIELKKAGTDNYLNTVKELNSKLIYKGEVAHLNNLPSTGNKVNDMYLVTALNEYYVYQYIPDSFMLGWWFFSKKFPIIYTEGKEPYLQISTELCPVLTSSISDPSLSAPSGRTWIVPVTEQPGILEGFPDSLGAEYGTQVLYYKGKINDNQSHPYPLGSSRMADYGSNPDSSPDLSASGLMESRYQHFLKWLAYETKPVTFKAILTRTGLSRLKFTQIYHAAGFNFLVKEVRVNIENDGLSVAEIDVYTC